MQKKAMKKKQSHKKTWDIWKTKIKIADTNPAISIVTLKMNELNNPIKRTKSYPTTCYLQEKNLRFKDINRLKEKGIIQFATVRARIAKLYQTK